VAKWWLITWTTYGTWLPGDERGYRTWRGRSYVAPPKRYAQPGESTYEAPDHTALLQTAKAISGEPVYLSRQQIEIALAAMISEIDEIPIVPAILSIGDSHVHWLCYFGPLKIRSLVERVKAAASRELNFRGFQGKRPWTKGCNMRSKSTRHECRNAYKYIRKHVNQGGLIYEWKIDPKYLPAN
jgi:hypothetical protein